MSPVFVRDENEETVHQVPTLDDLDKRDEQRAARGRFWIGTLTTTVVAGLVALFAFGSKLNNDANDNHRGHVNDSMRIDGISRTYDAVAQQLERARRLNEAVASKLGVKVDP